MSISPRSRTHLLKYHVVEPESNTSVAAFLDKFTAEMWAIEYNQKTPYKLEVRTYEYGC